MTEEALIVRYIEPNPNRPHLAEAWLKESAVPVWAIIGALPAANGDLAAVAAAYDVPLAAVEAAMAFYRRHQCLIDARLAENEPDPVWPYADVTGDG